MTKHNIHPATAALEILSCALGDRKCIYFSTPMTNGPRLLELHRNNSHILKNGQDYHRLFRELVLRPNCEEGRKIAENIRDSRSDLVLDPSCFDIEGWSQEDYLELWCNVIIRYAKEVQFNTGWQYSNGCVTEFLTAKQHSIPTFDLDGQYIQTKQAIQNVQGALSELADLGIDVSKIQTSYQKLQQHETSNV